MAFFFSEASAAASARADLILNPAEAQRQAELRAAQVLLAEQLARRYLRNRTPATVRSRPRTS